MQSFFLFLKGLIIGLGKVIPGVSGAILAILLGVYDEAILKINSFFKNKKESFKYLFPLGCGILLSIFLGSKLVLFLTEKYYLYTMTFFGGLILGTVPMVYHNTKIKKKDYVFLLGILLLLIYFYNHIRFNAFIFDSSLISYFYVFFLGIIDAVCMVLPGISATATYVSLGSYTYILNLMAFPFRHLQELFLFILGTIVGVLIMVKIMAWCFKKHQETTWLLILIFLLSSLYFFYLKILPFLNSSNLLALILFTFLGYEIASVFKNNE